MERKINICGAEATLDQLWKAFWQNFVYGFLAGALPTAVALKNDFLVLLGAVLFYGMLSLVLSRKPYKTRLGRFIVFPTATSLGFFLSYKILTLLVS